MIIFSTDQALAEELRKNKVEENQGGDISYSNLII